RQYTDEQVAALNGILEDIVGADEWAAGTTYPAGDFVRHEGTLYRALAENVDVEPGTDPAVWEAIGDYTSVGDALAAAISMSTKNASDIEAEASRVDAVVARMPAGAGTLATFAQVASEQQARADADSALGQRLDSTNAALVDKASTASVNAVQQASVDRDSALGQRIDTTNAALDAKASAEGLQQLKSQVTELDGRVDSQGSAILQVSARLSGAPNMLKDPSYARGFAYWSRPAVESAILNEPKYGNYLAVGPSPGGVSSDQLVNTGAGSYVLSAEVYRNSGVGNVRIEIGAFNAQGLIA
ncbi:carbohydrate-binding protein, partial [Stenotrophomonas sp. GD04024]|uniref:carbohydrate-binding protein n=1 Tax=Stenotrophomonas sp. GD04024 TaxID=2975422 RepID=UPI002451F4D3|nr:hypothetical protein [Stenotrophomonas sp. GD04024]